MKLLLAVDTITTLNILLDHMETCLWPKSTEARVLSVVEDDTVPIETWLAKGYGVNAVRHEMRRRGEQVSGLVTERLRKIGIPADVTVMRGDPAFLIPFAARKWSSELILIRAHNRMDFRNWLLGSVAKSIVDVAPCSVEIVRVPNETYSVVNSNMRILLATDGSEASLAASQTLGEMEYRAGTEVKVVSVINPISYSLEEIGLSRGKKSEHAHHAIAKSINMLRRASFNVTAEVIAGRRVSQILRHAKEWTADLIVLGKQPRRGLTHSMSRGTAATIANRAHCSVRVVRPQFSANEQLPRRLNPALTEIRRYKSASRQTAA